MLVFLLFLVACGPGGDQTGVSEKQLTGREGLSINFVEDLPFEDTVFEDTQFTMNLDIKNMGYANVSKAYIKLTTEEKLIDIVSLEDKKVDVIEIASEEDILKGRTQIQEGDDKKLDIKLKSKNIVLSEKQETTVDIKLCYEYFTFLQFTDLCLDPSLKAEYARTPVCTYEKEYSLGDQAAPVSIYRAEFIRQPEGSHVIPIFRFFVKNEQPGFVISPKSVEAFCGLEGSIEPEVLIDVEAWLGSEKLDCNDLIYNAKDDNFVECRGELISQNEAPTKSRPLIIKIDYGYISSVSKELTVEKKLI